MYCIRCGEYLKDGTKYCIYCGAATACAESMNPIDWNMKKKQMSDNDIFDISIPDDFIGGSDEDEDSLVPDEAGDESYTQAVSHADIKAAMKAAQESEPEEDKTEKIDFDIPVPDDFIEDKTEAPTETLVPDEAGDESYTQAVSHADIKAAMKAAQESEPEEDKTEKIDFDIPVPDDFIEAEPKAPTETLVPDEAEDESYTQAVSHADIKAAMKAMQEPEPDEEPTKEPEQIAAKPAAPEQDIPDIPIPMEFRNAGEIPPQPVFRQQEPPLPVADYEDNDDEEDEQESWVSARGIALVAVLVVLFFAIAVGAFVLVLRGSWLPAQDSGSGEVQTQVGFWGADSNSDSAD